MVPGVTLAMMSGVGAQNLVDQEVTARWRSGPIAIDPMLSVGDIGWDSNVFNDADEEKSDFTLTVTPRAVARLRLPAVTLVADSQVDFVHFAKFASERSMDADHQVGAELLIGSLTLGAFGSHADARRRVNSEIDSRSRRITRAMGLHAGVQFSGVTSLRFAVERTRVEFDSHETFDGANLSERLNRDDHLASATLRYAATPLTTFVVNGDVQRLRFLHLPHRDADSVRVLPGVEFDVLAVLNGRALVGFRSLRGRADGLPPFRGLVGSVDLTYPYRPGTRFTVSFDRDVRYSYRNDEPYYVLTGWGGSVRQGFADAWNIQARAAFERIDYQGADEIRSPDVVVRYSAQLSRELTASSQFVIDASIRRRHSPVSYRHYRGLQIYASATYGF